MPYGKGTYGTKVGRPPKKKTAPKKKPVKKWRVRHTEAREAVSVRRTLPSLPATGTLYTTNQHRSQVKRRN